MKQAAWIAFAFIIIAILTSIIVCAGFIIYSSLAVIWALWETVAHVVKAVSQPFGNLMSTLCR